MNNIKTIEAVLAPPPAHMVGDGFRVHNFFPGNEIIGKKRMSPFYLLDYNAKIEFSPRDIPRGVGVHPHRGFETVTIAYHGRIAHHDSAGNSGIIGEGDVQWMTAGSGLLHKEYHEMEFSRKGGLFQMVQLWVNLPKKDKMTPPRYQELNSARFGHYALENGVVDVIAGNYKGVTGPANTFTPIQVYNIHLQQNGVADVVLPSTFNTGILVLEGEAKINDQTASADHFVLFKNDGDTIHISANNETVLLVLSGEPIEEPIAQYGPFLMNTWQEVEAAINDVNAGKFGVLQD